MLTTYDHRRLDDALDELYQLTAPNANAAAQLEAAKAKADQIAESVAAERGQDGYQTKLLRPGWREAWNRERIVCTGWFGSYSASTEDHDREREIGQRLYRVFNWIVALVQGDPLLLADDVLRELRSALRVYLVRQGRSVDDGKRLQNSQPANAPAAPVPWLFGWPEILRAVGLKNNKTDRSRLTRLNGSFSGPILSAGKGRQPTVDRDKLVTWWNGLEKQFEEQQQHKRDQAGTVDSHYSHGRAETVIPNIQGSVKRRKPTRKP